MPAVDNIKLIKKLRCSNSF